MSSIPLTFDYDKSFHAKMVSYLTTIALFSNSSKTRASISVSVNNAYTGRSNPTPMRTMHSYMPYRVYAYGYHIPPIVKEKTPLRALAVVVNNHQHHYHSSDTDRKYVYQFCLTSHNITSMGHACLVEILYICSIFCLLAGVP